MENRFYCTAKRGQVIEKSATTIADTDPRVKSFFEPIPPGYREAYTPDGLPFNELIPGPTPEEIAAKTRQEAKQTGEPYALNGVDYMVPFMKDDADALIQVNAAFGLGVAGTVIYFTNGVKMPISAVDFPAFAVWFVNKRNAFFTE